MTNKTEYDINIYMNHDLGRITLYAYELVEGKYGLETNTDEIVDRLDLDLSSDDPKVWNAVNALLGDASHILGQSKTLDLDNIYDNFNELDDWMSVSQIAELGVGDPLIESFIKNLLGENTQEGVNSNSPNNKEQHMENKTIAITGTDINVGEAVESIMDKTAELPNDYNFIGADMYGVGIDPRDIRADVAIETAELTNKGLEKFREQFPAVDSVVVND